jgi:hypothetical protein
MKHTFTSGGKCKRLSPMTSKCTPIFKVAFMGDSQIFKTLVERANKHQIEPPGYHWKGFELKMPKVPLKCSFRLEMHEL